MRETGNSLVTILLIFIILEVLIVIGVIYYKVGIKNQSLFPEKTSFIETSTEEVLDIDENDNEKDEEISENLVDRSNYDFASLKLVGDDDYVNYYNNMIDEISQKNCIRINSYENGEAYAERILDLNNVISYEKSNLDNSIYVYNILDGINFKYVYSSILGIWNKTVESKSANDIDIVTKFFEDTLIDINSMQDYDFNVELGYASDLYCYELKANYKGDLYAEKEQDIFIDFNNYEIVKTVNVYDNYEITNDYSYTDQNVKLSEDILNTKVTK